MCAGGEFRTRDLQIMSIALVGEPLEITKRTGTLTRLSYPGILYGSKFGKLNATSGKMSDFFYLEISAQVSFSSFTQRNFFCNAAVYNFSHSAPTSSVHALKILGSM